MIRAIALCLLVSTSFAHPVDPKAETRYCGPPARDAKGKIKRSKAVIAAFKRLHPCPSTGRRYGACPGWAIDHVIPLASCGCDAVGNLSWLPNATKSGAGALPKDRWERRVYRCP